MPGSPKSSGEGAKLPRSLLLLLVILLLFSFPYTVVNGAHLAPIARVLVLGLNALFIALLVLAGTTAVAWAKGVGWGMRITGSGAVFLIVFVAQFWLMPHPDTQTIRVYLAHQGRILEANFSLIAYLPDAEPITKRSDENQISVQVPSHLAEIPELIIACPGYTLRDTPPFPIVNKVVRLAMVKSETPPPINPGRFPDTTVISDLPTREMVHQPPKHDSSEVTLQYKNISDTNLRLLVFDCSRHYRIVDRNISGGSPWMDWPLDARDEFAAYNKFRDTTGWFCFVVRDLEGRDTPVGCVNVCKKLITRLIVTSSSPKGFEGTFE